MKQKLFVLFIFSLFFFSIFSLGTPRDDIQETPEEEQLGTTFEPQDHQLGTTSNRTWERVIILEVYNFTHTEKISFPLMNISEEIIIEIYSAKVNSSIINVITLTEYLPINSTIILLFEDNYFIEYLEG